MRKVLLWSLLALVPFTNLRMICFDHAGSGAVAQAEEPDCSDFCHRKQAPVPETPSGSGCVLVADECSFVSAVLLSLTSPTAGLLAPLAGRFVTGEPPHLYLPPVLDRFSPPPQL